MVAVKLGPTLGRYAAHEVVFALVALAGACKKEPVDPERERCVAERARIAATIASSTQCASDSECEILFTKCGLPGDCGGVAIAKSAAPALRARSTAYFDAGCWGTGTTPDQECPDLYDRAQRGRCEPRGPAFCAGGTCKAAPPAGR